MQKQLVLKQLIKNTYLEKQFMKKIQIIYLYSGILYLQNMLQKNVSVFIEKLSIKLYLTIIKQFIAALIIVALFGYAHNKNIIETNCAFDTGIKIKGYYIAYKQYPNSIMFNNTNYYIDTTKKWNYAGKELYLYKIDSCYVFYTNTYNRKIANNNELIITTNE